MCMNCAFRDTSIYEEHIITKKYLDIGPSKISPWKALAAILENGRRNLFSS